MSLTQHNLYLTQHDCFSLLLFNTIHVLLFVQQQSAAKIGNSQGKSELDWIIARSASMPGPHDYMKDLPPQTRTPLRALAKEVGLGDV